MSSTTMSDEPKPLKDTFAAQAAKDTPGTIRDKTNDAHAPKPPDFAETPSLNLAPRGMMGIRRGLPSGPSRTAPVERTTAQPTERFNRQASSDSQRLDKADIQVTRGNPDRDLWISATFRDQPSCQFTAKVHALPSEHGIDGGRISKLSLYRDGELAAHYDRGWDQKPETEQDRQAVERLRNVYDGRDRTAEREAERTRSISRDWER
jgi:hypothetical protein